MDRDPRSRRAASRSAAGQNARPRRPAAGPAPYGQPNPQRPGYTAGAAAHRVTAAQRRRQRRSRALLGIALVVLVLVLGVVLSVNLLFKVTGYRITDMDGNTPADLGIYSEQQLLELLGVAEGDNLFGFSTADTSARLAAQLPYLDEVEVKVSLPGTVVVRVRPAVERFAVALPAGWLVLSDQLKLLRTCEEYPDGLIELEAVMPDIMPSVPGQFLKLETYNSLTAPETPAEGEPLVPTPAPTPAAGSEDANEVLRELVAALDENGLLPGVTGISVADVSELYFRYENRLQVVLGTVHNLRDKLRLAAATILDVEGQGLGATDSGVLDVSYQRSDGEIWAYLRPDTPTPAPEPDTGETGEESGTGEDGETGEGDEDAGTGEDTGNGETDGQGTDTAPEG